MLSNTMSLISRRVNFESMKPKSVVIANFNQDNFSDFLKFMAYAAYMMKNEKYTHDMVEKWKQWGEGAKEFAKDYKVSPKLIDKAISSLPFKWTDASISKFFDSAFFMRDFIHDNKAKLKGTKGVKADWLQLINALDTFYNSGSDNSYKNIEKYVSKLGSSELTRLLNNTVSEQANPKHVHDYLNWLRRHLKDPKAVLMPTEERAKLKGEKLEKFKELNKNNSNSMNALRRNIVRQYGDPLMPVQEYKKEMAKHGIELWQIPKGFDGKIDEEGKYYTKNNVAINGLPIGGTVKMNPQYHQTKNPSTWVAKGKGIKQENETAYYSLEHVNKHRESKKEEALEKMEKWLPKMQKEWRSELKGKGQSQMLAMMAECMYLTSARVGTNENAQSSGGNTYGLCTWLVKHIRPLANGSIKITYRPGKSKISKLNTNEKTNVDISHIIKPETPESEKLIEYIKKLIANKKPSEPLWQYQGKRINSNQLNAYLKELSDGNISPKNFRTFRGTKLFLELLAAKPPKKNITEKELKAYHDKISQKVGEILGHVKTNKDGVRETTATTAQKSYINPQAQIELYRDRGFLPPSNIRSFEKE